MFIILFSHNTSCTLYSGDVTTLTTFFQINSVKNGHGLGLNFCSVKYLVVEKASNFPALYFSLPNQYAPFCDRDQSNFNFHKVNFVNILYSFISLFDWYSSFSILDFDSAVNIVYDELHQFILVFVYLSVFLCIYLFAMVL